MMTQAEYARYRAEHGLPGGTIPAIEKAIRTGRITLTNGRIDPAVADREWEAHTRPRMDIHGSQEPNSEGGGKSTWVDAKARTEAAVARMKELDLAQREGTLIDRDGYERAAQKSARMLRDALIETLPAKICVELAALSDPWAVQCRLRDALRAELAALSADLRTEAESSE